MATGDTLNTPIWLTVNGRLVYIPAFVTQTNEPAPWIDCTWAAGVMLALKANYGLTIPATRAEREALRAASGDLVGGSTTADLVRGLTKRYGVAPKVVKTQNDALIRLAAGWGACLAVDYGELPQWLRRWDTSFTGWHRVYVGPYDAAKRRLYWMDPLGRSGYEGEWVALADITDAVAWGEVVMLQEGALAVTTVTVQHRYTPARAFRIAAGTTVKGYSASKPGSAAKVQTFSTASGAQFDQLVSITQSPDPSVIPHGGFIRVTSGAFAGLFISPSAPGITADITPPADPDTAEIVALKAEVASLNTRIAGMKQKTATYAADIADD